MNSNQTPFKKRSNPFSDLTTSTPVVEEVKPVAQPK